MGIFKLGCQIAEGSTKHIYYEVWDDGEHYGNICGGGINIGMGLKTKAWEFVPACGDTGGVDQIEYERLAKLLSEDSGIDDETPERKMEDPMEQMDV